MSDDIVFHGGGSVAVSTGALVDLAERLERIRDEARLLTVLTVTSDGLAPDAVLRAANAPISAFDAQEYIQTAAQLLGRADIESTVLAAALRASALGYGIAEELRERALGLLADRLGHAAGFMGPIIARFFLPIAIPAGAGMIVGNGIADAMFGEKAVDAAWSEAAKRLLSDPATVQLLKLVTRAIDDMGLGVIGLPPVVADAVGESGLGISNVTSAAASVLAASSVAKAFHESRLDVERRRRARLHEPPTTYEERLRRIPHADSNGGSQVRIDRYKVPGEPDRFEVYISGTQAWAPSGTDTPFDLGSNVRGVAEWPNGAVEAVRRAMKDAGVDADTPVTFVGHSQGALIAHQLAASGEYKTVGVIGAGPPASASELPKGVDQVILAHDGDIVTALGGPDRGDDAVIVTRDPKYDDLPKEVADQDVPMHSRELYWDTAAKLDASENSKTGEILARMNELSRGATEMTSTLYKAERKR